MTARDVVDFESPPAPDAIRGLGLGAAPYTGNARPSQAWFDAARDLVDWVTQETVSTRSQEGFTAGVYDCQFAESRARERGWTGPVAVVVSDGNGTDQWDASEYGRGWASVATLRFFPYGAVGVIASFLAGAASSPLLIDGEWVPETWGAGRVASQLIRPGPLPGTDLNRVHIDLMPVPPSEDTDMPYFIWAANLDGTKRWALATGDAAFLFTGAVGTDEFGRPADMVAYQAANPSTKTVDGLPVTVFDAMLARGTGAAPPAPPCDPTTLTNAELEAELARRLG